MGNRILKESIRMSEQIDSLSWFEETVFYRLIVTVDDYGVYHANPVVLAHILFPLGHLRKTEIRDRADAEGLAGWVQALDSGMRLEDIINGFANSAEFKTIVNGMK